MKTEWEKGRLFGLQVAIERMGEFWGHEIVRIIARDLCRKNRLPLPEVTPPAAHPPKVTPPWQMPGYDWTMDSLGPVPPSAPPAPASPPPEDCSTSAAAPAAASPPTLDPPSADLLRQEFLEAVLQVRHRLDVLEVKALAAEKWQARQQPAPLENVVPLHWPRLRPLHPTSGQEVKAVLRWTGWQWVVVEP